MTVPITRYNPSLTRNPSANQNPFTKPPESTK